MDGEIVSEGQLETSSCNDDGILYDVTYHVEFPDEKEVVRTTQLEDIPSGILYRTAKAFKSSASRWTWSTIRAVGIPVRTGAPCMLPPDLIKLNNCKQCWKMARSPDGNFLAILQDGVLEIRSSKDEYNIIVGRCVFSKDPNPQWRTLSWNIQSTAVAFSDSDGTVHVCDIKGIVIVSYHGHLTYDGDNFDYSTAVCALSFLPTATIDCDATSILLMIVSYSGSATCLEINENYEEKHKAVFQFDFFQSLPKGVSAATFDINHNILIVGGCTGYSKNDFGVPKATRYGITAWRLISEEPFLKSIDVFIEDGNVGRKRSFFRRLSTVPADFGKKLRGEVIDGVFTMAMSPCGRHLVVIHLSGALSVWEIPSFRLHCIWMNTEQPFYGSIPVDDSNALSTSKKPKTHSSFQNIINCKWWDDSSVIIARCSGSLAVVSVMGDRLESLFGDSCEWLEPAPDISFCRDEGFVALECETNVKALKRQRENTDEGENREDDFPSLEDSDDEASGVLDHLKNNTKSAIYQWTDIDYFRPPRKRPKLIQKSYRLLSITKTTPEKLFEKRLEDEEYGEALALAQKYNLDGDKVFQRQWKKSTVSIASIQDYLSKISKRSWVLHECCERVPEDLDAAKELLKFALSVTDIDELVKISEENNDISNDDDSDYEEYQGFDVEEQRNQEIRRRSKFVETWSKRVDFSNLSLEQKELIRARKRIIKYSDRLSTYEILLGGYDAARERYNKEQFSEFRQKDIFTIALEYARDGNWKALDTILTFYHEQLKEHWLPLLSNIPKTVSPTEYRYLLPGINEDDAVEKLEQMKHRDLEDWCENPEYSTLTLSLTGASDPSAELYEDHPSLVSFKTSVPTHDLVTHWYVQQAMEFDADALDIDGALELLKIGSEKYVAGLEKLTDDLRTLETLVYECDYDTVLTLKELQKKSKLERLKMLMSTSSKEMYIKNFHRWALPFLKSCKNEEEPSNIFQAYVRELAENDLTLPSLIFTSFLRDRSMPKQISSFENLAKFAFECIYINSNTDQLDLIKNIYSALVNLEKSILKTIGSDKIARLDNHIFTCSVLSGYNVKVTPDYIREVESDRAKVEKLLVRFSRTVGAREPSLDKNEWNAFLKSMLQLKDRIFAKSCGLESAVCIGVFVESLLTSGNVKNFKIAGEHMMRTSDEEHEATRRILYSTNQQKLSYESSVALVIKASQEYFDASSPTTNDNMLSLARECLLLISDRPESIRERLDLIEGVVLLQKFKVDKLPLQVRLMEDRLSLIRMALNADDAYRKTEPLLRLAMLLHVCGNNKDLRKGKVLIMIVEKALLANDLSSAHCLCQELVSMPFPAAWEVCFEFAKRVEFEDLLGRRDILSFVMCHCHDLKLTEVMELINELNYALLRHVIFDKPPQTSNEETASGDFENHITDESDNNKSSSENAKMAFDKLVHTSAEFLSPMNMLKNTAKGTKAVLNATGNALSATGAVLSVTSNTTKTVLSNVKNAQWWKSTIDKTLTSGLLTDVDMEDLTVHEDVLPNSDLEFHGCVEFYSDIIDDCICKYGLKISEDRFYVPKNMEENQALLRARQLCVDNDSFSTSLAESGLLETLVEQTLPYDFALGISYLLAVEDLDSAYRCLKNLPVSVLSLQLSLYYLALRLAKLISGETEELSHLYEIPPLDLIKEALDWISTCELKEGSQEYSIASHMNEIREKLFEFAQGEKLQCLDRGIDLKRFTADAEYREETILGLAMTMDDEQYKIAVSSAHRSGTDLWLVLMTHLEFLFTECQEQLDSKELQKRIDTLNMMPELIKKPSEFLEKMDRCILPFISGKDHDRLIIFFSLLSQCKDKEFVSQNGLCQISPVNHVKMLEKIASMASNLDYKSLMSDFDPTAATSGPSRILNLLHPILDTNNVQMLAKMLPQIPYSNCKVTSSLVYLELSEKIMVEDAHFENSESSSLDDVNWIAKYESCGAYLRLCFPNDLQTFFEFVLFQSGLSKNIPLGTRQDLIKRGVKLCKIQATKERKKQLDDNILNCGQSFNTVLPAFLRMLKHLDSFSTSFLSNLIKNATDDNVMMKYLHLYDESQSKPELILDLGTVMLEDGASPSFIQNFFAVVPGNKWTCKDVLNKSIDHIVSKDQNDIVEKLTVIVKSVGDHEKEGGKILSSIEVIDLLRSFCSDANIDSKLRVDVLKLLEDQFELEESEAKLLMLHRTEALIRDSWDEESCDHVLQHVGSDGITQEKMRYDLFERLLHLGDLDLKKCKSLVALLDVWPAFEKNSYRDESWCGVLMALTETGQDGYKELIEVVRNRLESLPKNLITNVFHKLIKTDAAFYAIKLALLASLSELQEDLIMAVKSIKVMGPSQCDEEVLVLLLERSLAVHTVGTLYYGKISEYLLSGECPNAEQYVHQLARQLQDLGHLPEAGTLLLNFRGTHPAFRTFNNALSSLRRWINS